MARLSEEGQLATTPSDWTFPARSTADVETVTFLQDLNPNRTRTDARAVLITEVPDDIRLELRTATAEAVSAELATTSIPKDRQWADAERQAGYTMQHDPKRRLAIGLNVLTSAVEVMLTDCMRARRAEPSQAAGGALVRDSGAKKAVIAYFTQRRRRGCRLRKFSRLFRHRVERADRCCRPAGGPRGLRRTRRGSSRLERSSRRSNRLRSA